MFYNSSKFGELEITETALYSPGGVIFGSSQGYWYCYSWANPNQKIWGPTRAPGGVNTLADDVLLGASQQLGVASGIDALTGKLLWENAEVGGSQSTQAAGYGMFYVPCSTGMIHAFDIDTGKLVWQSKNLTASYWNEFFLNVGDGKVFCCNRDGNVYCLDAFTGELKWSAFAGVSPYEPWKSYYGSYGYHIVGIGGGSTAWGTGPGIYSAATGDESIGTLSNIPGNQQYVYDTETGELLFKFPGGAFSHNQHGVVADGLLVTWNPTYSQVQCFGKGNTKVELSTDVGRIANGDFVVVNGRITDQSPAQPDTPCVSKESMEAWMTYIHGGYDAPPAGLITGVPVSLVAVDSANNVIDLGTVTSDAMGYFKVSWTPTDEGMYKITASFAEDESYYSSWTVTDLTVTAAAVSATSGTGTPVMADATMTTVVLAAIVVVGCIGAINVVALWKMRRHKGGNEK